MALVPLESAQWQNDGYRITFVLPGINKADGVEVDPIIQGENTLRSVLSQLAGEEGVEDYIRTHTLLTLDRPKHDELKRQATEFGMPVIAVKDGDAVPAVLRGVFGIPGADGKQLIVISTSGGCEGWMVAIAASLARGSSQPFFSETRLVSRVALKDEDGRAPKENRPGTLTHALDWKEGDRKEIEEGNEAISKMMAAHGLKMGLLPTNVEGFVLHAAVERELLAGITEKGVFAQAQVTGATEADAGIAASLLSPVTWYENNDGTGEVHVRGFVVSPEGGLLFYQVHFTTNDILSSRYAFLKQLTGGSFVTSEMIQKFEDARGSFWEAVENGRLDVPNLGEYVRALETEVVFHQPILIEKLHRLLISIETGEPLLPGNSVQLQQEIQSTEREIERTLLGEPYVITEKGGRYSLVQTKVAPAGKRMDRGVSDQI
jgi:hypothetical protein